jgi:type VI secretion system VasD/TssJ family lipoprotein
MRVGVALCLAVTMLAPLVGCASRGKPRKACAVFQASDNLNLYDGEPHPITVYVYALSSPAGFEQATVADLLEGDLPGGVLQPPVPITVSPDEKRSFSEMFPAETSQLGILADYYRAPGDPEGTRTQVVRARCGLRKPKLVLSPKDVYRK